MRKQKQTNNYLRIEEAIENPILEEVTSINVPGVNGTSFKIKLDKEWFADPEEWVLGRINDSILGDFELFQTKTLSKSHFYITSPSIGKLFKMDDLCGDMIVLYTLQKASDGEVIHSYKLFPKELRPLDGYLMHSTRYVTIPEFLCYFVTNEEEGIRFYYKNFKSPITCPKKQI